MAKKKSPHNRGRRRLRCRRAVEQRKGSAMPGGRPAGMHSERFVSDQRRVIYQLLAAAERLDESVQKWLAGESETEDLHALLDEQLGVLRRESRVEGGPRSLRDARAAFRLANHHLASCLMAAFDLGPGGRFRAVGPENRQLAFERCAAETDYLVDPRPLQANESGDTPQPPHARSGGPEPW